MTESWGRFIEWLICAFRLGNWTSFWAVGHVIFVAQTG